MIKKELNIDGTCWKLLADPLASLAHILQRHLHIDINDFECGKGNCEECFVIINGEVVFPCAKVLQELPGGAIISTKNGLGEINTLQAMQISWALHGSPGCSRCAGRVIGTCAAMLEKNPFPTEKEVEGWFCNKPVTCCNGEKAAQRRLDAIINAARVLRGEINIGEFVQMVSSKKKVKIIKTIPAVTAAELGINVPPGALHLALVHAGVANVRLQSINLDGAWVVPGVCRVITSYDVLGSNMLSPPMDPSQSERFFRPVICKERIINKNEVIAVVCADTQHNAFAAAQRIEATYKYFSSREPSEIDGSGAADFALHSRPYEVCNIGLASLDEYGRLAIHSKYILPDQYRSIIARAIGLDEEFLVFIHTKNQKSAPRNYFPIAEAILGLAFLSTGKPVFMEYNSCLGINGRLKLV